jgi:hypothetical protein
MDQQSLQWHNPNALVSPLMGWKLMARKHLRQRGGDNEPIVTTVSISFVTPRRHLSQVAEGTPPAVWIDDCTPTRRTV